MENVAYLVVISQVGHAGTLDPMATGLLIVCVGKATKVVDRFGDSLIQKMFLSMMIYIKEKATKSPFVSADTKG